MGKKESNRGFSGLSDLASDVSGVDHVAGSQPSSTPSQASEVPSSEPKPSKGSGPEHNATTHSESLETVGDFPGVFQPRSWETTTGPPLESGGGSGYKWIIGAAVVFFVFLLANIGGQKPHKPSYSSTNPSQSNTFPENRSIPITSPNTSQHNELQYDKPPAGTENFLPLPQLRWCIREEIRIETLRSLIDTNASIDEFNSIVDDFNNRCLSFRYSQGTLEIAKREVEQYRTTIESEVKIGHTVKGLKASEGPAIATPPGSSALIKNLCTGVIFPGAILDWRVYDSSGVCKNQGVLKIIFVENHYFSAIQSNIYNKLLLNLNGSINEKTFKLYNPKWNEAWQGECNSENISGYIYIGTDQKKFFSFTLTQTDISQD